MDGLRLQQQEVRASIDLRFNQVDRELKNIKHYVRRSEPFVQMARNARPNDVIEEYLCDNTPGPPAKRSKTPKTLHDLWDEYQNGSGGYKAARLFTPTERGACKFTFSRRLVIWKFISRLVRNGHTSDVAISKIYDAYGGNLSVTKIINKMRADNKDGGHSDLM